MPEPVLPESEKYALDNLMPALARGGSLSDADKKTVAERVSYYTGISENYADRKMYHKQIQYLIKRNKTVFSYTSLIFQI